MGEMQSEFMAQVLANYELWGYSGSRQSYKNITKQTDSLYRLSVCLSLSVRFDSIEPGVTHATWLKKYMFP